MKQTKAEKKELKAQKKAEKKAAATPEANETKQTLIKAATAVVCVAALCASTAASVGTYTDAMKHASEIKNGTAPVSETVSDDIGSYDDGTDSYIPTDDVSAYDEGSQTDMTSDTNADTADDSTSADSAAKTETKTDGGSKTKADSNDPLNYSKEQIVKYYNSCLKNTYKLPKLKIDKVEDIKIVIDDVQPGGEKVANFGNKIVDKYAKATPFTGNFANGENVDGGDGAEEFSLHANLDPKGAKSATIKKSGSGYEINITVVYEKTTLENRPVYNSQCANPLDLGAVDLFGLKVTQADFNYPGTTLKAVVDGNGRVTSASSNMPMFGSGAGNFAFIKGSATVHGSMVKTAKFTF